MIPPNGMDVKGKKKTEEGLIIDGKLQCSHRMGRMEINVAHNV
jgi:hypothetical protein